MENFAEYVAEERDRLTAKRQAAMDARRQADLDLDAIEAEFHAINAYEAAKSGKRVAVSGSNGVKRLRHGSRRSEVLAIIHANGGLKRRDILEGLHVKGDKAAEMSVSNALTNLVKTGNLQRDLDGVYTLPMASAENESVAA
jgi:hypothetical protein